MKQCLGLVGWKCGWMIESNFFLLSFFLQRLKDLVQLRVLESKGALSSSTIGLFWYIDPSSRNLLTLSQPLSVTLHHFHVGSIKSTFYFIFVSLTSCYFYFNFFISSHHKVFIRSTGCVENWTQSGADIDCMVLSTVVCKASDPLWDNYIENQQGLFLLLQPSPGYRRL